MALYRITTPPIVNFLPYVVETIMVAPWAITVVPLALIAYHPLPTSSSKNFTKFSGDGKVTMDKHIKYFFTTTHILGVAHKDVSIRLFVETLTKSAEN